MVDQKIPSPIDIGSFLNSEPSSCRSSLASSYFNTASAFESHLSPLVPPSRAGSDDEMKHQSATFPSMPSRSNRHSPTQPLPPPPPPPPNTLPHYGVNPDLFTSPSHLLQFITPTFAQGGPAQPNSNGPAFSDTSYVRHSHQPRPKPPLIHQNTPILHPRPSSSVSRPSPLLPFRPDPTRPVYSLYGHSVHDVNPDLSAMSSCLSASPASDHDGCLNSPFDASRLGIQLPVNCNYRNVYSSSGFDLMRALANVVNRPNPQIDIGPVDTSAALVVVDARKPDLPIIFTSASFTLLTGYENSEVVGQNCRFLQFPRSAGPVNKGTLRTYSDPTAAYHMKSHIRAGKESQSSIINYRKDGRPFVNLVTLIPITWDSDEIAYYVGFQVDLVQQPNAIMACKANGTYMTHYNLPPQILALNTRMTKEPPQIEELGLLPAPPKPSDPPVRPSIQAPASLDIRRISTLTDTQSLKSDSKTVLDENHDMVMVVSLKGTLFYVSPACSKMLGHEDEQLVNQNISMICHSGDLTGVLRQLKEAGNTAHTPVDLIFRAITKSQSLFWMEAQGQLHVEAGKGRKYVVLVGRPRTIAPLSWQTIQQGGGLGDREFWTKLSLDGMCLYSTGSVRDVLGYQPDQMLGKMIAKLAPESDRPTILKAILAAWNGTNVITIAHSLTTSDGTVIACISDFYPPRLVTNQSSSGEGTPTRPSAFSGSAPIVYCQTNEAGSAKRRASIVPGSASPSSSQLPSPSGPSYDQHAYQNLSNKIGPSMLQSNLSLPGVPSTSPAGQSLIIGPSVTGLSNNTSDNIFSELDTLKKTAWNFELSELKIRNKALRAELTSHRQKANRLRYPHNGNHTKDVVHRTNVHHPTKRGSGHQLRDQHRQTPGAPYLRDNKDDNKTTSVEFDLDRCQSDLIFDKGGGDEIPQSDVELCKLINHQFINSSLAAHFQTYC